MTTPKPATTLLMLQDRLIRGCRERRTFFEKGDLFIHGLHTDAKGLQKSNYQEWLVISLMIATECGQHKDVKDYVQQLSRSLPNAGVCHNILVASSRLLKPSLVTPFLQNHVDAPTRDLLESVPPLATIGAHRQFYLAIETLKKAKVNVLNIGSYQHVINMAKNMRNTGVEEATTMAIMECAGKILEKHHLKWVAHETFDTFHDGEMGVFLPIDVAPSVAAKLDVELFDKLSEKELDTVPFFVSFIGTKIE